MLRRVVLLGQLEIVLGALVVQADGRCEQLGDRVLPIVAGRNRSFRDRVESSIFLDQ
jgi:hypothetical protein